MSEAPEDRSRRLLVGSMTTIAAAAAVPALMGARQSAAATPRGTGGCFDAKADFGARGDGMTDDTDALQKAILSGSRDVRPVLLPPGCYKTTRVLSCPPNTMLLGSAPGLGFGCRLEPTGCPAFLIGGAEPSFHCSFEDLMIWPKGKAPEYIVAIDNSYSITFRNIRIHDTQQAVKTAAVLLLGDAAAGGHGRCNNIIWDNLIVRNDTGQPSVAVLAAKGCGTHRFVAPCFENFATLLEWQGGQLDLYAPYTERAGRYAVNCNTDASETTAYFNSYGGVIDCAESGLGCAIRASTRNFNSFGTYWGLSASKAAQVYALPATPATFHGIQPNLGPTGRAQFGGVDGWQRALAFPQHLLRRSVPLDLQVAANGESLTNIRMPPVSVGNYWVRAALGGDPKGLQLSAWVSAADTVAVVARNGNAKAVSLSGTLAVECGWL